MTEVLLTGATGVLGRALHPCIRDAGYDVHPASRNPPAEEPWVALDLTDGTGLPDALSNVDTVVHAASDARGDSEAVDVRGTERLVEAAEEVGLEHLVYVSIVGIGEIPYSYYQHKLEAERIIETSDVPHTIVRVTQFHEFIAAMLASIAKLPIWLLPRGFRIQPIAASAAADAIVAELDREPSGDTVEVGGPEVRTARELGEAYRVALGARRPIVSVPLPGKIAAGFRDGKATCPDQATETVTWEDWLDRQEGTPGTGLY